MESLVNWEKKPYTPKSRSGRYVPGNMEEITFGRLLGKTIRIIEVGKHHTRWGGGHGYATTRDYVVIKWNEVLYFAWVGY